MNGISDNELVDFFSFLRFPSVSANPEHAGDVRRCAEWLAHWLEARGLAASLRETGGAPVVVATNPHRPDIPTVMLYGHYDVQPVEPLEQWESPPFEPEIRDGFVFARGATDNKGQTFSHLIGLQRWLATEDLPVNLTILIEGEEEIGSPHLGAFVRAHREELACDVAVISDTSMVEPGWPALTLGLRGIACFEVTVEGPPADLHSGMFGGATPNPAEALCRILGNLHDSQGRIAIPGLYDDVLEVPEVELKAWQSLPWQRAWFEQATGLPPTAGEVERTVLERVWARPTAEINGLTSGHQGAGSKTIIPSRASAKLSFRLAPAQKPDDVARKVIRWFEEQYAAAGMRGNISFDHAGDPFYTAPDDPHISAAREALEEVFGRAPALTREGLSIPVAALFQKELEIPVVLAGLGLPDCRAHSPNESYPLEHLRLGAEVFAAMIRRFAQIRPADS